MEMPGVEDNFFMLSSSCGKVELMLQKYGNETVNLDGAAPI